MKLYHLSDLHLGAQPPFFSPNERDAWVLKRLKEVLSQAKDEGVSVVIFAGDTFDSNAVLSNLASNFFEVLSEFPEFCFVLIPGGGSYHEDEITGHDAWNPDCVYLRPEVKTFLEAPHINLLTPTEPAKLLDISGKKVAFYAGFFSFPEVGLFPKADHHIAVMHGAFGTNQAYEIPLTRDVLSKFDYLALGHYHGFKKLAPNAFYSGAFIQFEYLPGEKALSGYIEVSLTKEGPVIKRKILPNAPSFLRMRVIDKKDLDDLKRINFEHCFLRIETYLENFEEEILAIQRKFAERIEIAEGAKIPLADILFYQTLEKLLEDVPEEIQDEVREFILYGLLVAKRPADLKYFLEEKYLKRPLQNTNPSKTFYSSKELYRKGFLK